MITLYGAPFCAFCKTERQWLDSFNIEYEYKDIEDSDVANELISLSGSSSIPVLTIRDKADNLIIIKGFDRQRLSKELKLNERNNSKN